MVEYVTVKEFGEKLAHVMSKISRLEKNLTESLGKRDLKLLELLSMTSKHIDEIEMIHAAKINELIDRLRSGEFGKQYHIKKLGE